MSASLHSSSAQVVSPNMPDGQGVDGDRAIHLVLIDTAENVDMDAVQFAYGAQSWNGTSGQCPDDLSIRI